MSALFCGIESLLCLGCARWAYRRCTHTAAADSSAWSPAAAADFSPIPRACRAVLAAYETDLAHPRWAPSPHGYRIPPTSIIRRATYADTAGRCPPYLIYSDNNEVVLAVRGLGLTQNSDYRVLLDNWGGGEPFDGGFVHRGLLGAARWVMEREGEGLVRMVREMGAEGRLVLAGHSLGAGVAALLAVLIVNELGIERGRVRCYCVAPARCMSLNLAVKYADVIHSVVLQDDFLPRTPTPLEHIFGSMFCLPCLLCGVCMRDTFVPEEKKLKDPRRLYAPGRMYHIIERKSCRCGRFPPEVRTAIPVEGRFEYIVLSCNAIFDHSLVWIERETEKALEVPATAGYWRGSDAHSLTSCIQGGYFWIRTLREGQMHTALPPAYRVDISGFELLTSSSECKKILMFQLLQDNRRWRGNILLEKSTLMLFKDQKFCTCFIPWNRNKLPLKTMALQCLGISANPSHAAVRNPAGEAIQTMNWSKIFWIRCISSKTKRILFQ